MSVEGDIGVELLETLWKRVEKVNYWMRLVLWILLAVELED